MQWGWGPGQQKLVPFGHKSSVVLCGCFSLNLLKVWQLHFTSIDIMLAYSRLKCLAALCFTDDITQAERVLPTFLTSLQINITTLRLALMMQIIKHLLSSIPT